MGYFIRMSKDRRNVSKNFYFKHFEQIYKYMMKAEQSKLSPQESIALFDTHVPLKSACTHYLTYPNKIGILNSFPTMEKLNAHFMSDKN